MEQLHLRVARAQADALKSTLEPQLRKGDDAPPRKMLRTLKRMASASITCFETHKELSTHQTLILKKLSLKSYTKQDLIELRRAAESLVYIIQLPHDRGTYTTALRLLSFLATAPDPIAFILLERHIHPILRRVLENSIRLPQQGSISLALLLEHLSTRHYLSIARHTLFDLAGRDTIDEDQMNAAEKACSDLLHLAEDPKAEIWVRMMVQDLLALVAKHPRLGFSLLQDRIYPRVYRIANEQAEGVAPGKLSRRLARLAAAGSPELAEVRQEMSLFLVKMSFTQEEAARCRELLITLLSFVLDGERKSTVPAMLLLEEVARSKSQASRMLTEAELYSRIEELWARGVTSVDTLYRLVKDVLSACLSDARALIESAGRLKTLPLEMADRLVGTFHELLDISRYHEVYDEATVDTSVDVLLLAATATESISALLMDPNLVDRYGEIWDGVSGAPRSPQVKRLLTIIQHNQARLDLQEADMLISRLKHTREWSGLDSDDIKPLVHTLLSCATDPNLRPLQPVAINALVDLAKSPADCAAALLLPEFDSALQETITKQKGEEHEVSASRVALAQGIAALQVEMQLRNDLPRLSELSELPIISSKEVLQEFEERVGALLRLCREEAASGNGVLMEIALKGLLIIATGRTAGRELLRKASGHSIMSPDAFRTAHSHQVAYISALHGFMHDLETAIDGLMQLSDLRKGDETRLQQIAHRLVQTSRQDLMSWSTTLAIELLGSLAKRPEAVFVDLLRAEEISGPLRQLGKTEGEARLVLPINRIMRSLGLA